MGTFARNTQAQITALLAAPPYLAPVADVMQLTPPTPTM
jgi:hypothetical protein